MEDGKLPRSSNLIPDDDLKLKYSMLRNLKQELPPPFRPQAVETGVAPEEAVLGKDDSRRGRCGNRFSSLIKVLYRVGGGGDRRINED